MQLAPELGIPEVKPAIESIRGRWYQKMSPRTRHSVLQARMVIRLTLWASGRGLIGTEWRFYLLPRDEPPSSLVPDVAYVAEGRLPEEAGDARERPVFAPDIAVEILSPGDRKRLLETKIGLYFAHGAGLVLGEIARSRSFPDLTIDVDELFARIV